MKWMILGVAMVLMTVSSFALDYLPDSTYGQANNWQGSTFYSSPQDADHNINAKVDFTVYDSEELLGGDEQSFVNSLGLEGRYIYAYQIFQTPYTGYDDIGLFQLVDAEGADLVVTIDDITWSDWNTSDTKAPDGADSNGSWSWNPNNGLANGNLPTSEFSEGYGEISQLLIFSSDNGPVAGGFKMEKATEQIPVDNTDIPEPMTVFLLGLGGLFLRGSKSK